MENKISVFSSKEFKIKKTKIINKKWFIKLSTRSKDKPKNECLGEGEKKDEIKRETKMKRRAR
jgi:hypothetical protein